MKRTGLVLALLLVLPGFSVAQPMFSPTQDPLAGERVFSATGCVKCHVVNGTGGKVGPDLTHVERSRSFHDLSAVLWNHALKMAARMRQLRIERPQLDARESAHLVAFLFTLNYFDPKGNPSAGRRLKGCLNCHGLYGERGKAAGDLSAAPGLETAAGVLSALWNHSFIGDPRTEREKTPWPAFRAAEMADLVAFLRSVQRTT